MEPRIAELVALLIVAFCIWRGVAKGFVKTIYSVVRNILSIIISILLAPLIVAFIPQSVTFRYAVAYVSAFLLSCLLLGVLNYALSIFDHIPVVKDINKFAGALAGLAAGILILWVTMMILGCFTETPWCVEAIKAVQKSEILMKLQHLNPLGQWLAKLNFPVLK